MTTPNDERLRLLNQPIGGEPNRVVRLPPIIDSGRTKPVPRTLQQAFPISEGYRIAAGRALPDGRMSFGGPRPSRLRSLLTADRIAWLCVWGLIAVGIVMAWRAPKGLG
jgi:hypothetical protein